MIRYLRFEVLDEKALLPMSNPFFVKCIDVELLTDSLIVMRTGINISLPDNFTLLVSSCLSGVITLGWNIDENGLSIMVFNKIPNYLNKIFAKIEVIEKNIIPVKFIEFTKAEVMKLGEWNG